MPEENYVETYAQFQQSQKTANEKNLALVFDALQQAGITSVVVGFDGEGDDGQITETTIEPADKTLPDVSITVFEAQHRTNDLLKKDMPLSEAIEEVCYLLLDQDNEGWENNDGALGEFTFDVASRNVALEFNARFTDFNTSNYSYGTTPSEDNPSSSPASTIRDSVNRPGSVPSIEPAT
jgi:hypothetical protein